jgi:hypothetical protein
MVDFEKLRVPGWFEIHEPGEQVIRFEVGRAVQVNAPPQAFSRKWLLTPVDAEPATTPAAPTLPPAAARGEAGRPPPAR